ncbi:MAG: histone deacetylase, partial [Actinomycetota bacterium]
PDGTRDDAYLAALEAALATALSRSRADLALYIAGADPYEGDRLGRLALTKTGLAARDEMVLDACWNDGLPVAIVCGGGYCADLESIVDIHAATRVAAAARAGAPPNRHPE